MLDSESVFTLTLPSNAFLHWLQSNLGYCGYVVSVLGSPGDIRMAQYEAGDVSQRSQKGTILGLGFVCF